MPTTGHHFSTEFKHLMGLRDSTPWTDDRVRAYHMCARNYSAKVISEMLKIKTRRSLLRFARKIQAGNIEEAVCHGNLGRIRVDYRGAFAHVYRAVAVEKRDVAAAVLRAEIIASGAVAPSGRTLRRWVAICTCMGKRAPKLNETQEQNSQHEGVSVSVNS